MNASQAPCAIFDVGSNTIRLLIYQLTDDYRILRIELLRAVTRLGRSLHKTGIISKASLAASVKALTDFKRQCDSFGVREIRAIGTSALREALNGAAVVDLIRKETGVSIEVISGQREAELTVRGVYEGIPGLSPSSPAILVDIGGGSTEWAVPHLSGNSQGSFPAGALTLFDRHLNSDPPSSRQVCAAKAEATELIGRHLPSVGGNPFLIVTGGTVCTLAAIDLGLPSYDGDAVHRHLLQYEFLIRLHEKLITTPLSLRVAIPGLERKRADIIITGNIILIALMEVLSIRQAVVSDYGLLEGFAAERRADNS